MTAGAPTISLAGGQRCTNLARAILVDIRGRAAHLGSDTRVQPDVEEERCTRRRVVSDQEDAFAATPCRTLLLPSTPGARQFPCVRGVPARHVLDRYPLIRRECIDRPTAVETPDARVLFAAKRTERQIVDWLIVDVRHPGLDLTREPCAALEVTREDGARQSIRRVVGELQRVLLIGGANQRSDRTEDLLTCERAVICDVCEDVRRQHPSARRPANQLAGAGCACFVNPPHRPSNWLWLITGPIIVSGASGSPTLQLSDTLRKPIREGVVDALVDDQAVCTHADLTLVQEPAEYGRFHALLQVGILEHDEWTVASELELDAFDEGRLDREFCNVTPDRRGTGEGNHSRRRVGDEGVTDFAACSDGHAQHAWRKSRFLENLARALSHR